MPQHVSTTVLTRKQQTGPQALHITAQHCTALHSTAQQSTSQHSTEYTIS
jgi:hypothetical protein